MCGCKWRGVLWSVNVLMRMCMKPTGSKTISVQEQEGNNSTQDEYKHWVEGRDWLAVRDAQPNDYGAIVSVMRRKKRVDLPSRRNSGTPRFRKTEWDWLIAHTGVKALCAELLAVWVCRSLWRFSFRITNSRGINTRSSSLRCYKD